jgi:parallel beta-helix repeat protein
MKVFSLAVKTSLLLALMQVSTASAETLVSECGVSSATDHEVLIIAKDIEATTSPCITVSHDNVTVDCQGHQLVGMPSGLDFGIRVEESGEHVIITDCKLSWWWMSISQAGDNGLIVDNLITDCGFGLVLTSADYNTLLENKIGRCSWDAFAVLNSNQNLLRDNGAFENSNVRGLLLNNSHNNEIIDNRFGRNYSGIYLTGSNENILIDNVIKGHVTAGIRLHDSYENYLEDNVANKNDIGIKVDEEDLDNIFIDNVCRNNTTADSNLDGACN